MSYIKLVTKLPLSGPRGKWRPRKTWSECVEDWYQLLWHDWGWPTRQRCLPGEAVFGVAWYCQPHWMWHGQDSNLKLDMMMMILNFVFYFYYIFFKKYFYINLSFFQNAKVGELLKKQEGRGAIVAAICAGVYILTHCGLGDFNEILEEYFFKTITVIDGWDTCCEIALRRMSLDLPDDKSTLVQVMACCRLATSHYLSQCWPRSLTPYGVTRSQWVNSLAPGRCHCNLNPLRAKFFRLNKTICLHFM